MTRSEEILKDKLERHGFTVLKNGWPDFLCYRNVSPNIGNNFRQSVGVMTVESKVKGDKLSEAQKAVRKILHAVHIPVHVLNPHVDLLKAPRSKILMSKSEIEGLNGIIYKLHERIKSLQKEISGLQVVIDDMGYIPEHTEPLLTQFAGLEMK